MSLESSETKDGTKAPHRTWAIAGFLGGLAFWAWYLYADETLLMDTNLGLVWGLMGSGMASLPALGFSLAARRRWPFAVFAAASIIVVGLCATPWHPRKRFLNDCFGLIDPREKDVTSDEMHRRMARWTEIPCGLTVKGSERPFCYTWVLRDPHIVEIWTERGRVTRLLIRH